MPPWVTLNNDIEKCFGPCFACCAWCLVRNLPPSQFLAPSQAMARSQEGIDLTHESVVPRVRAVPCVLGVPGALGALGVLGVRVVPGVPGVLGVLGVPGVPVVLGLPAVCQLCLVCLACVVCPLRAVLGVEYVFAGHACCAWRAFLYVRTYCISPTIRTYHLGSFLLQRRKLARRRTLFGFHLLTQTRRDGLIRRRVGGIRHDMGKEGCWCEPASQPISGSLPSYGSQPRGN